MRIVLLASVAMCIVVAPASARDKKPVAAADGEKRVCRAIEKTGSIMPGRKICHTRAEWSQIDGANEQNARDAGDRNRVGTMPGRVQ